MKKEKVLLVVFFSALVVGGIFRSLWLTQVPNGLNRDEVVIGYDAYCILMTGKDKWGEWLPFFFRGFDNYLPGILPYSNVLWVWLLGPTDLAIRLAPFFYGMLTLLTTYFLTRRIFKNKAVALWALFFLAIAPWHIFYSRFGNPNILVPFFHTLALLLFFKGLDENKTWPWVLSSLVFGLCFHAYYGAYITIPLSLLGLLLIYRRELWQRKKELILPLLLFLVLLTPHIYHSLYGKILTRGHLFVFLNAQNSFFQNLSQFIQNYFFYYSIDFLFDKARMSGGEWIGRHGVLYWIDFPLLLMGIFSLLTNRSKKGWYLLWWLLIYPIPASLTGEHDNDVLRTSTALPVFQILSGLGAWNLFRFLWTPKIFNPKWSLWLKRITLSLFCISLVACVSRFSHKYFIKYPYKYAAYSQYGMKQMCLYIKDKIDQYDRIVISGLVGDPARRRPNIFLAYYLPIDPKQYHQMPKRFEQQSIIVDFWKFQVDFQDQRVNPKPGEKVLYVVREEDCRDTKVHKRIYYPNGKVAFKICEYLSPES